MAKTRAEALAIYRPATKEAADALKAVRGSLRLKIDDAVQDVYVRALESFRPTEHGSFVEWATLCAKKGRGLASRAERLQPERDETTTERVAFTGRRRAPAKLPRGYDRLPDGHVVRGRYVPAPARQHADGTRTVGSIFLQAPKGDWSWRKLSQNEQDAVQELLHIVAFATFTKVKPDGSTETDTVDEIQQAIWARIERTYKAAFGCTIEDAPWHRAGGRLAWEVERLLMEGLAEECNPTPRMLRRATHVEWLTDEAAARILDSAQLGRGGGKTRKGDMSIGRAVLREINVARKTRKLQPLRNLLSLGI
jgi:hypothetical protein